MNNEENKYYTPTIDEFYPGFEFEYYDFMNPFETDGDGEKGWKKSKIQLGSRMDAGKMTSYEESIEEMVFDYSYFFKYPNWTKFRVKYLDKEDIESVGFVYKETITKERDAGGNLIDKIRSCYIKDIVEYEILLNYFPDTHYILIRQLPEDEHNYCSTRFMGIIKNKSELKKLLKQLGIDEKV